MKPVIINKELCTGCGICVAVCPYKAIGLEGGSAEYLLESCFCCAHCQSVCPEGAVSVPGLHFPVEMLNNHEGEQSIESESTRSLIRLMAGRRSCRNYRNKDVPVEILEDLIQIGITAPSGTNCQDWNFVILPSRGDVMAFGSFIGHYFKRLNRLAESGLLRFFTGLFTNGGLNRYYENHYDSVKEAMEDWDEKGEDRLFHGAKAAILVTAKKHSSCPAEDAMLATGNILLAAHSMGLGTCLIGFAVEAMRRDKNIGKKLMIPDDEQLYAVIALGYPKISYLRPAGRKKVTPRVFRFDKAEES